MPQKIIRPNEIYWLFFKIEFLDIIKRERKKIATKREREAYRKIADDVFLEGMHSSEPPVPAWKKYAAYYAVRMFGRWAINSSAKREV